MPPLAVSFRLLVGQAVGDMLMSRIAPLPSQPIHGLLLVMAVAFGGVTAAHATPVVIPPTDHGWYSAAGNHSPANINHIVGRGETGTITRNFFVFQIPASLTDPSLTIESAELRILNFAGSNPLTGAPIAGFASPDASEVFELYSVSTPVSTLVAGGTGQTGIYADLGSGTVLGQVTVSGANNGGLVHISLNSAALSLMKSAAGQLFAFGGAITTLGTTTQPEHLFAWSSLNEPQPRELRLEIVQVVPEPAALQLTLAAALSLAAATFTSRLRASRKSALGA